MNETFAASLMRHKRVLLVLPVLVLGGLGVALLGPAAGAAGENASASGKKFNPKNFKGTYDGTWTNTTFKTSGGINSTFIAKKKKFTMTFDVSGSALGCSDPDEEALKVKKSKKGGANTWTKKGFNASGTTGLGELTLTYKHKKNKLKGTGKTPACAPDFDFSIKNGKLTEKALSGTIEITSGGAPFATSSFSAKKQK